MLEYLSAILRQKTWRQNQKKATTSPPLNSQKAEQKLALLISLIFRIVSQCEVCKCLLNRINMPTSPNYFRIMSAESLRPKTTVTGSPNFTYPKVSAQKWKHQYICSTFFGRRAELIKVFEKKWTQEERCKS